MTQPTNRTIFEKMAAVDAAWADPTTEEATWIQMETFRPPTWTGLVYSETVKVDIGERRPPEWLASIWAKIRRLDEDPEYGFYVQHHGPNGEPTGSFRTMPLTARAAPSPELFDSFVGQILRAAEKAGWKVYKTFGDPGSRRSGWDLSCA